MGQMDSDREKVHTDTIKGSPRQKIAAACNEA